MNAPLIVNPWQQRQATLSTVAGLAKPYAPAPMAQQPQFGSAAAAARPDLFLRLAESFLAMPKSRFAQAPIRFISELPGISFISGLVKKIPGMRNLGNAADRFVGGKVQLASDFDYREANFAPFMGRTLIEPPSGALVAILYGFTIVGRLKHAIDRAVGGDIRELRDIAIRDIPSITIFLFMLNPAIAMVSKGLEQMSGLRLTPKGTLGSFGFSTLDEIYTMERSSQLKALMADKFNEKGALKALQQIRRNPNLAGESTIVGLMHELETALKAGFGISKTEGFNAANPLHLERLNASAEQAFSAMQRMDIYRTQKLLDPAHQLQRGVNSSSLQRFISKMRGGIENMVPPFRKMFSSYSQWYRVFASIFGYAVIIGLLGYGVTAFNKWYSEREYAIKMAEAQRKATSGSIR